MENSNGVNGYFGIRQTANYLGLWKENIARKGFR